MSPDTPPSKSHLLIAGTGRAGTTFLVKYLDALGLETHLAFDRGAEDIDANADAGLEDFPLLTDSTALPYVVKTPWLYQVINQTLADPTFVIDGVIIPIRRLSEAATSRSTVEYQALHRDHPWATDFERTWTDWGHVPGGAIYSLTPLDQARVLAVGLHLLLERLVESDVRVALIGFPKLLADADYLYERLKPLLPSVPRGQALAAHAATADVTRSRITQELGKVAHLPNEVEAENLALRREVQAAKRSEEAARTDVDLLRVELSDRGREIDYWRGKAEATLLGRFLHRWRSRRPTSDYISRVAGRARVRREHGIPRC